MSESGESEGARAKPVEPEGHPTDQQQVYLAALRGEVERHVSRLRELANYFLDNSPEDVQHVQLELDAMCDGLARLLSAQPEEKKDDTRVGGSTQLAGQRATASTNSRDPDKTYRLDLKARRKAQTTPKQSETAVDRAIRRATVIANGLICSRCKGRMRIQAGGIFLPGAFCDACHSGVLATEEWKDAMRALGAPPTDDDVRWAQLAAVRDELAQVKQEQDAACDRPVRCARCGSEYHSSLTHKEMERHVAGGGTLD